MARYKVGDKVRVRKDLKKGDNFSIHVNWTMEKYAGKIVTIRDIDKDSYSLEEVDYYWRDDLFEGLAKFTKSELKNGDFVTLKNGGKLVVCSVYLYHLEEDTYYYLTDYNESLTYNGENREKDIVLVERPIKFEEIFKRRKQMSLKEIEKELGYEIEIVDEKGE